MVTDAELTYSTIREALRLPDAHRRPQSTPKHYGRSVPSL